MTALYTVRTWDMEAQAFTPQVNLTVPSVNIPLWTLKRAIRELRNMGYGAYYVRGHDGDHELNDPVVLVERTDGERPLCGCRGHWDCTCGFPAEKESVCQAAE